MARDRIDDLMQSYSFWLFDAGTLGGNVLFPVFDPALAFSAITSPEITAELRVIQPGNWEYKRRVVKTSDVSPITLSTGVRFSNSDMYNWITNAILGRGGARRTLFLIHFLGLRADAPSTIAGAGLGALAGVAAADPVAVIGGAAGGAILGSFIENRIPGRAWVLHDCLPSRYKSGSDFDAASSAVSVQELEVQPEYVTEVAVGTASPVPSGALTTLGAGFEVVKAL